MLKFGLVSASIGNYDYEDNRMVERGPGFETASQVMPLNVFVFHAKTLRYGSHCH